MYNYPKSWTKIGFKMKISLGAVFAPHPKSHPGGLFAWKVSGGADLDSRGRRPIISRAHQGSDPQPNPKCHRSSTANRKPHPGAGRIPRLRLLTWISRLTLPYKTWSNFSTRPEIMSCSSACWVSSPATIKPRRRSAGFMRFKATPLPDPAITRAPRPLLSKRWRFFRKYSR